jgi:SulP family sulfate permease
LPAFQKLALRRPHDLTAATLPRDLLAGVVASLVTVAYCISFAALIFQGDLAGGLSLGLAALLTGTVINGVIVCLTTSLAPVDAGPDSPAVAVISVLAASIAAALSVQGMGPEATILHVLIAITLSTFLTGALLVALGGLRLGAWLRFVPYPVIGGFLAASGWLLIVGGVEVATGVGLDLSADTARALFAPETLPKLGVAIGFAAFVFLAKRWTQSFFVLPLTFFGVLLVLDFAFLAPFGPRLDGAGWFLEGVGDIRLWLPFAAIPGADIDWGVFARHAAEIGAVCGVTAISMLLDVSSLEVARQKSADLDAELRSNGAANVVSSFFGGVAGNLSLNGSILINEAGAVTRWSGVFAAVVTAIVLFSGIDLASLVPKPLLGGLLAMVGIVIFSEALLRSPAQRSAMDFALAGLIMLVIVYSGYLLGVAVGVVGACLMFALSYSRIGVVRRHLTRAEFSSNVERSQEQTQRLREEGRRIHVFWLSGYIFFGSSNGLFERIRKSIDQQKDDPVRCVLLDFSGVPGVDTSAVLSLVKLRNYCEEHGVALVFSGLTETIQAGLEKAGFFSMTRPHKVFESRNEALEWCEDVVLLEYAQEDATVASFDEWLARELGDSIDWRRVTRYFERREVEANDYVFRQGQPSDSVELVATGSVAITISDELGRPVRLRRMSARTVVGEMGFYRGAPRGASVVAETDTIVYGLSRDAFARMQQSDPMAAAAFHQMIVRVLADRLEFANREISALL